MFNTFHHSNQKALLHFYRFFRPPQEAKYKICTHSAIRRRLAQAAAADAGRPAEAAMSPGPGDSGRVSKLRQLPPYLSVRNPYEGRPATRPAGTERHALRRLPRVLPEGSSGVQVSGAFAGTCVQDVRGDGGRTARGVPEGGPDLNVQAARRPPPSHDAATHDAAPV